MHLLQNLINSAFVYMHVDGGTDRTENITASANAGGNEQRQANPSKYSQCSYNHIPVSNGQFIDKNP